MAVAAGVLSGRQKRTLEALCDTWVPAVDTDGTDPLEASFLARPAADIGVADQIEDLMADAMTPAEIAATGELLDALADEDFATQSLDVRVEIVAATAGSSFDARHGLHALKGLTMMFFYALPDAEGLNPNWEALGYPGPNSPAPSPAEAPKTIRVEDVQGAAATLRTDVCVVGSGAGGAVVAAGCAAAGMSVLVLEMGSYRNESDFKQLEIPGMFELYLGGGLLTSENGSIAVLAGSTLGGGTVVNYMNCIRTPQHIREEWAQHGLEGLDAEAYERDHIDVVSERLGANTEMTRQNGTHQRLMQGLDALGLEHRPIMRNAAPNDDPEFCGYCAMGCQHGCKRSTMKTWLQDASDAGARCVVQCRADRVLVEDGRAVGVAATITREDGSETALTIEAPSVVVACGSVESPALLLRSQIGGPAVGKYLRLHPVYSVNGIYDDPVEGWRGQLQSLVSDSFADIEDGFGFLIEAAGIFPGLWSAAMPWSGGADHKRQMAKLRFMAPFIAVQRDHGSGEVVIDDLGRAVVRWDLDDEVDQRLAVRANVELARLHHAAGAGEIFTLHADTVGWQRGQDFDAFLRKVEEAPYGPLDITCFSAHQMGSCRMGKDPATSVADGRGELHDVKGVWVGDASAFPTAPGVNPMISIMSLAHRTADHVVASQRG